LNGKKKASQVVHLKSQRRKKGKRLGCARFITSRRGGKGRFPRGRTTEEGGKKKLSLVAALPLSRRKKGSPHLKKGGKGKEEKKEFSSTRDHLGNGGKARRKRGGGVTSCAIKTKRPGKKEKEMSPGIHKHIPSKYVDVRWKRRREGGIAQSEGSRGERRGKKKKKKRILISPARCRRKGGCRGGGRKGESANPVLIFLTLLDRGKKGETILGGEGKRKERSGSLVRNTFFSPESAGKRRGKESEKSSGVREKRRSERDACSYATLRRKREEGKKREAHYSNIKKGKKKRGEMKRKGGGV